MKKLVIGMLAHVDAGKTTLSEAMLYLAGGIRTMGRVDKGNAFLDTHELEKERGITIFSRQAVLPLGNMQATLLDTPGHVDFSAEMERTLQVLDCAVLVISGADGVQGHTQTLWRLLEKYKIPVFIFINKMDQEGTDRESLLEELKRRLSDNCLLFGEERDSLFYESIAVCGEKALEHYLEEEKVEDEDIRELVLQRRLFPCFFGSALRLDGVDIFLEGIKTYASPPCYDEQFGAKVFKITRDAQGERLTWMKITGGCLRVKDILEGEKVNQIRIYSGEKYEAVKNVSAGSICAVTGLSGTQSGSGFGREPESISPVLSPVLTYRIILPADCDPVIMFPRLLQLSEEDPTLHITYREALKEIHVQLMGEVQTEILKRLIGERFGIEVEFGEGNIVYRETIADCVIGVGHYEPLRHYAEVHLLLEPLNPGSGLQFGTDCSLDMLAGNWQSLILTHLKEKEHKGVLTGSAITDMKITLIAGKAHQKHTEGGDFRQATYRALRQGLKEAQSVLLEPIYEYRLELPEKTVGRAMADIERMAGTFEAPLTEGGMTVLTGIVPAAMLQGYQKEVLSYTGGQGRLSIMPYGYAPCHNAEEIIEKNSYDPERDMENPTGSVFCAHGAGFTVDWNHVKEYMHVKSGYCYGGVGGEIISGEGNVPEKRIAEGGQAGQWLGTEEVDEIIERTFGANRRSDSSRRAGAAGRQRKLLSRVIEPFPVQKEERCAKSEERTVKKESQEEYLLVDGYNMIFSWEGLKELAGENMNGAREKLKEMLCNYQAVKQCHLILVFDAYRVQGHDTEYAQYHNIQVVFTKQAETADQFIEKFAHENGRKYRVTVATSDGLEQIIIRGQGCMLMSARELEEDLLRTGRILCEKYESRQPAGKSYLMDVLTEETLRQIETMRQENANREKEL